MVHPDGPSQRTVDRGLEGPLAHLVTSRRELGFPTSPFPGSFSGSHPESPPSHLLFPSFRSGAPPPGRLQKDVSERDAGPPGRETGRLWRGSREYRRIGHTSFPIDSSEPHELGRCTASVLTENESRILYWRLEIRGITDGLSGRPILAETYGLRNPVRRIRVLHQIPPRHPYVLVTPETSATPTSLIPVGVSVRVGVAGGHSWA